MMKTIICRECGQETVRTSHLQKYCPECRKKVAARQKLESQRRRREGEKLPEEPHTRDSEEMMAMCLTCKLPRCKGECIKVKEMREEERRKREEQEEAYGKE